MLPSRRREGVGEGKDQSGCCRIIRIAFWPRGIPSCHIGLCPSRAVADALNKVRVGDVRPAIADRVGLA